MKSKRGGAEEGGSAFNCGGLVLGLSPKSI